MLQQFLPELEAIYRLGYQCGPDLPFSVDTGESPDFRLRTPFEKIGLEVTWGCHEEYRRGEVLSLRFPRRAICVTNLVKGAGNNTALVKTMLDPQSPAMEHSVYMTHWCNKITGAILTKRRKLNGPKFKLFERNWLLIVDRPGLPNDCFAYDDAFALLKEFFSTIREGPHDFDATFILSEHFTFWHTKDSLHARVVNEYPMEAESAES